MNGNLAHGRVDQSRRRIVPFVIVAFAVGALLYPYTGQLHAQYGARPLRIGIEAGHNSSSSGAGNCDGSLNEYQITRDVALIVAQKLRERGYVVDVFQGDVEGTLQKGEIAGYRADAFVALHVDQCVPGNTGFKVTRYGGAAGTGLTGDNDPSDHLVRSLWTAYGATTGLPEDRSPGHFAPGFVYYHALNSAGSGIAPETPGAIIEMGWISGDFGFITSSEGQELIAEGISLALDDFFRQGVDVVLAIDSSGSMTWNDTADLRKWASKAFVATMSGNDRIAIVDFDDTATVQWPLGPVWNNRDAINSAIDRVDSVGGTNIGAALQAGYTELGSSPFPKRKAAVLLTDGDGYYHGQSLLYASRGWPVYTIGLGSLVNDALLKQIAENTGGQYYHLVATDGLAKVYFEIATDVAQGDMLMRDEQTMAPGGRWDTLLSIFNLRQLFVFVSWPGSEVSVTLVTPDGTTIGPETTSPGVFHAKGLTFELYRIENPISGDWLVRIYGDDLAPEGELVTLQVSGVRSPVVPVLVDVAPGEEPNSINCTNPNALVTAAILSTDIFDATTIDHASITLEGAKEVHVDRKTGLPQRHEEDVDGDGRLDLVFHFALGDTWLGCESVTAVLLGQTFDGQAVEGSDRVDMVEPNRKATFTPRGD